MHSKFSFKPIVLALSMLLVGCGNNSDSVSNGTVNNSTTTSDNGNSQQQPNERYDSRNFKEGSKAITKTEVKLYEGPSLLTSSKKVDINVEDKPVFVYETRVNHRRSFSFDQSQDKNPVALFDFQGRVHITIKVNEVEEVKTAKISPQIYGITPKIEKNVISFDLEYADNYVIEYNGDSNNVIHLFTSPIEEDVITEEEAKKDSSITYIGPGIYEAGAIPVKSNSTIYIAGGAYVYGQIRAEDVENITIRGRGIISGEIYDRSTRNKFTLPVEIVNSTNVTIKDLTFLDPAGWCITLYKSKDINIDNVKIMTARANGDGISVQSCSNVNVKGGFIRSWDDTLVVKNSDRGVTDGVTFDGVTLWTDMAQSMEVGYEADGATMKNITFKNITVVHNFCKAAMSIHNCDDADISSVRYENITPEDGQMHANDMFIDMTVAYNSNWSTASKRGTIKDVTFDDIKVYKIDDSITSKLEGESATCNIDNVTFKDIDYASKKVTKAEDISLATNDYVSNVKFENTKETKDILGAIKTHPYRLDLKDDSKDIDVVKTIAQDAILVPSYVQNSTDVLYVGEKMNTTGFNSTSSHGAGNKTTTPADDGSGLFSVEGHDSSKAFDDNMDSYFQSEPYKGEENEFVALTIEFDQLREVGVIRVKGLADNRFIESYHIAIFGRKIKNDGTVNPNYTRILTSKEYTISPLTSNCADINISTQEYMGLQLRFFKGDSITSPNRVKISEVEFYPPSLTYQKSIYDATTHNDVYPVTNLVDGEVGGTSYYESKELPAHFTIDLEKVYHISKIVLALPPTLLWQARTQEIEIKFCSQDTGYSSSLTFTTVKQKTAYLFDPSIGNRVTLDTNDALARFIKVTIYSNTESRYGGQLSEVSAYGY